MKTPRRILALSLFLLFCRIQTSHANEWADTIERLKPTVVNLEVTTLVNLGFDEAGTRDGTGFIVDAERGIVATNRHLTSTSPARVKITFIDGSSVEGKVLYYDYYHDFAFVQFDVSAVTTDLQEVRPGSSFALRPQQSLLLIGNNEKEEYSVKIGMVVNLNTEKGDRHSEAIHTSFDRTGGASGSPVFNQQEQVVGIHFAGTDTSSFELPVEYLTDALRAIRNGNVPPRGDIGVELRYVNLDDAILHADMSDAYRAVYKEEFPASTKVVQIHRIIPASPAEHVLKPGDIIWSADDHLIGDNLYLFDKVVDQHAHGIIAITVLRRNKAVTVALPVQGLEDEKINKFALFGGGTIQDITAELRRKLNYRGPGVFMNQVQIGSTLSSLGVYDNKDPASRRVIIRELDGQEVKNLEDFIRAAQCMAHGTHTTVIYQDLLSVNTAPEVRHVSFDLMLTELRIFELDEDSRKWEEVPKEPCAVTVGHSVSRED